MKLIYGEQAMLNTLWAVARNEKDRTFGKNTNSKWDEDSGNFITGY